MGEGARTIADDYNGRGRMMPTLTLKEAKFWKDEATSAFNGPAKRKKDRKP